MKTIHGVLAATILSSLLALTGCAAEPTDETAGSTTSAHKKGGDPKKEHRRDDRHDTKEDRRDDRRDTKEDRRDDRRNDGYHYAPPEEPTDEPEATGDGTDATPSGPQL